MFSGNFTVLLDVFKFETRGFIEWFSGRCQDDMFSLITQTVVCLDTCCLVAGVVNALQDQTQTDCPPLPLSLPHMQLGRICTGAQT